MILDGRMLTMSFTYRGNRVGERTLPCETPSLTLISAEQSIKLHSGHSAVEKTADRSVSV